MKRVAFLVLLVLTAVATPGGSASAGPGSRKRGSSAVPVLDDQSAQAAGFSQRECAEASKLYKTKCMRCHKSYDPSEYPQPEWESWMVKMRKKAHLAAEQESLLTRYLQAYRGSALTAKTNTTASGTR